MTDNGAMSERKVNYLMRAENEDGPYFLSNSVRLRLVHLACSPHREESSRGLNLWFENGPLGLVPQVDNVQV